MHELHRINKQLFHLKNQPLPIHAKKIDKMKHYDKYSLIAQNINAAIIETGNKAAKNNFMEFNYDPDNPMDLTDCIAFLIHESLPDNHGFDTSEIYDFINSKMK